MENRAMSVQKIVEISAINILNIIFSLLITCLPGCQHINFRKRVFTLSYLIFVIAMAGVGQWIKSQMGTDQVKDADGYTITHLVYTSSSRIAKNIGALRNVHLSTSAQLLLS